MRPTRIADSVLREIARVFASSARARVVDALSSRELAALPPEAYPRVHFAILRISGGDLHRLDEAIDLAARDWRDVLVAAGLHEANWEDVLRASGALQYEPPSS